jgi:hypothetical protein
MTGKGTSSTRAGKSSEIMPGFSRWGTLSTHERGLRAYLGG